VQYPPRERCRACLGDALAWRRVDGAATVLAHARLAHSLEAVWQARLPCTVVSAALDAGPVVLAHVESTNTRPGARLRIANTRDARGAWCLVGFDAAATNAPDALAAAVRALGLDA
jgi:uncharacterized OB-fold protein